MYCERWWHKQLGSASINIKPNISLSELPGPFTSRRLLIRSRFRRSC